jgi:CubicO group peptidase (beta-lactamase class C family)
VSARRCFRNAFAEAAGRSALRPNLVIFEKELVMMESTTRQDGVGNSNSFHWSPDRADGKYQPSTPIQGTFDERFRPVYEAFARNLDSGMDVGASAAVFIDGEPVVDIWGGYFDATFTRSWERDTIINTFATTKTMTALCALILADRGEIDLNAPVAKYWPEFAAEGKGEIEVRQILGYTSGMAGWSNPMTLPDLCDVEKSTALLARQAPWWKPGTGAGYHTFTIGHLIGEIIRRVTGKTLGTFFAEEVAGPLGADYHIGTGPEHDHRVAPFVLGYPINRDSGKGTFADRSFFNPAVTPYDAGTVLLRRSEQGGGSGHGTARGVAAVQSVLACGGEARGVRLLSETGAERVLELQSDGVDLVMGLPIRWGMGYCLGSPVFGQGFGPRVAFWGGNGGSLSYVDLDTRMAVGFVMNRWITGPHEWDRNMSIVKAAYTSLAR